MRWYVFVLRGTSLIRHSHISDVRLSLRNDKNVTQAGGLGEARGLEMNQPCGGYAEGVSGVG